MANQTQSLQSRATRGAAWSGISTIILRLGGLTVGVILARILTPQDFGVYAVALTIQAVFLTVADLGLSADLIRSDTPEKIAPTVATLGLTSGALITILAISASSSLAEAMGSAEAGPAIAILSWTLLLGGATVVPYGMLLRRFQQKELFIVGVADFIVSTVVTLTLLSLGLGVLALAIGRVSAQIVSTVLQFILARVVPRFGVDRSVLRPVLAFGLPIAAANLLSWTLLNIDNVVLARVAGATALGYYVLAFNISSWPMSALSQVVRSISMPYFSRVGPGPGGLIAVTAIGWAGALPAGAVLATLSAPLIEIVYGEKWLPAAPVLAALGLYGSLRVVFDIFAGYLYARGRSKPVLWVQIVWLVVLVIGMVFATQAFGIMGAAWIHVAVALAVVLPAYLIALNGAGVRAVEFLSAAWWPTVATMLAVAAALVCRHLVSEPLPALLSGGLASVATYVTLMWRWFRRRLTAMSNQPQSVEREEPGNV